MEDESPPGLPPFQLQSVLSELYHGRDLLDFSAPGPSSPPKLTSPTPAALLFSSATSIAAAAGRRAAAVASAAASPSSASSPQLNRSLSPGPERVGTSAPPGERQVRCVEGYGNNLYIGGSDGVVEWWVCDGGMNASQGEGWTLRHRHTVFPRRPIAKIILLPKVSRIFFLSDGTLHPLALPNLEVLPSTVIAPMRGVLSVVLNDEEMEWGGPGADDKGAEMLVVVVRRKGLGIYKLGSRMVNIKEIPLPAAPIYHALFSTFLCAAIPQNPGSPNSPLNYCIIDLSDASLTEVLPVSQIDAGVLDFEPTPNIVVIPGENEFLVTSYTGASTMGVFLNGQGDPVRGTMEWEDHPLSITVESGHIIALLRSNIITIHALVDLDRTVQTIHLNPSFHAFQLSYSPYGIAVRDSNRDERMMTTHILLLGGRLAPSGPVPPKINTSTSSLEVDQAVPTVTIGDDGTSVGLTPDISPTGEEPPSGSGLTPPNSPPSFKRQPITPTRSSSLLQATAPAPTGPFSTTVAETLILGPNGIMSINPTPIVKKLEHLCAVGNMEEAISLVDEERRKGRRGEVDSDKATHQATMRFLHLYLAYYLFTSAMFERAGDYFLRGKIDPRLIVRAFSSLRGKIIGSAEEVEIYQGLQTVLEEMPNIDDIISGGIKRIEADGGPEMREALLDNAKAMLTDILRKTRQSRRKGGGARGIDSRKIDIVIDTTLSKLLAESGTTNELLALLAGPNDAVLSELEPFLASRPYVLATVLRQQGKVERVLELLQSVAENPVSDPLCPDPVEEFYTQLESVQDPVLLRKYALWLVERDSNKGLSILINHAGKSGVKLEDASLVEDLRKISEIAANRYLEHVVVGKKSPNRLLHEDLLARLLDSTESEVKDDGVKYHLEELDAEYRMSPDPEPFCVFLADIAPDSPIKTLRLKLMLFLQGSPFFDLPDAARRLEAMPMLKFELAVILGRLGRNRSALHLLAREIGDSVSAQTYCTQGGEIIPPRIARRVASRVAGLEPWAALTEIGRKRKDVLSSMVAAPVQEGLVMELLGVYMRDGATTGKETAALLNAQSVHLDALQVLELMPNEWPLDVVSSFIQRSLRRQIHDRATWQILKAISAGQNLETSEQYLTNITKLPPVVVKSSPGNNGSSGGSVPIPDEGSIAEKENGYEVEKDISSSAEDDLEEKERDGDEEKSPRMRNRSFFSLEGVNKELQNLKDQSDRSDDLPEDVR